MRPSDSDMTMGRVFPSPITPKFQSHGHLSFCNWAELQAEWPLKNYKHFGIGRLCQLREVLLSVILGEKPASPAIVLELVMSEKKRTSMFAAQAMLSRNHRTERAHAITSSTRLPCLVQLYGCRASVPGLAIQV